MSELGMYKVERQKSSAYFGIARVGSKWRAVNLRTKTFAGEPMSRAKAFEKAQELDDLAALAGTYD